MGLMTSLNKEIKEDKENFGYNKDQFTFKSGLKLFNYCNGQTCPEHGKLVNYTGIDAGKSIMIIGKAGTGKSTFALQLASSIMRNYEDSTMFIFDFEQSHTKGRIQSVTGMSDEYFDDHVTISKVGIYSETVLKLVNKIAQFKHEHEDELLVENKEGQLDKDGKLIKILPPTIVFIDSLATMRSKDFSTGDELSSLTMGARNAGTNKDLFNRMLQPCMEANIILICINHITTNLNLGGITPAVAQTRYLRNTEAVSGGAATQYLANLWISIEAGDKLDPGAKSNIYGDYKGFRAIIKIVKSRNSEGGKVCNYIFNQREGYDEILSEFEFLKNNGAVKGAGVGMYLDGLDTVKFRASTVKDKYNTVPEFKARFEQLVDFLLEESLKPSSKILELVKPEKVEETATTDSMIDEDKHQVEESENKLDKTMNDLSLTEEIEDK